LSGNTQTKDEGWYFASFAGLFSGDFGALSKQDAQTIHPTLEYSAEVIEVEVRCTPRR
jgi:hypothetical protein